ncbi:hypothetical protein BDW02DRAFT_568682 [Decorospora gaudefroyi]|uniref:Asl1-like glycosyl hydrolase catalytic domain-containing protein n=1 Tax=Decorospora gaudefroyi TaxID=184978 RepID=A0A6A5KMU7_9PLEO|nr:hypothetical protein BDW02DRAFT_568682 [Decorospora gaudefroyi]
MSSAIKITSLLALVSTVAAVPHYSHGKYHSSKAVPYPIGSNATVVSPSGTGAYDDGKTTTLDTTSTSTQTVYSTIFVSPSSAVADDVDVADASTGQCGGTVTVTASEKVTVTVTASGADDGGAVPTSSVVAVESSTDYGYDASSSASPVKSETPVVETPVAETTTSAGPEYPAVTPEPSTSSATADMTSSVAEKPVSSATPGNTYSGAKRGLAYNEASLCKSFGANFGWAYNWGQAESTDIGATFIPTMHGPSKSSAEEWLANVDKAVDNGSTAVMGFNECDHAAQCNLEPEAACAAWKSYMNPIKSSHPDVTIIGPSITNGPAPMGLDWLTRFKDCCSDALIDATNMHFYDDYDSEVIGRFQKQVESAAAIYGQKVWVTEFGLNSGTATEAEAASFLKEAMAYLDSSDLVQGYSWFMVGEGEYQLNAGTGLSAIGQVYASS